jgi:dTDP-4-dehydrorhamnose reductase
MPRILLTGASGQLGSYLLRELRERGASVVAWSGARRGELFGLPFQPVDLRDPNAVTAAFRAARPDIVVHTAALAAVGDCYRDPAAAHAINVEGSVRLAELAADAGARLVYVSTDMVFDGEHAPYREGDPPAPLSVYGRSKACAESALRAFSRTVIIRVSLLYGSSLTDQPTLLDRQRRAILAGEPLTLFDDEWRTPLDLPTAARGLLAIAESDYTGILHLGGPERLARLEMGERLASALGCNANTVAVSRNGGAPAEPRPCDVSLDSARWRARFSQVDWPRYDEALRAMVALPASG